jgi:hypothetical protein
MLDFLLGANPPTYTVPHTIGGLRQFKLGGRDNIRFENLRCRQKKKFSGNTQNSTLYKRRNYLKWNSYHYHIWRQIELEFTEDDDCYGWKVQFKKVL